MPASSSAEYSGLPPGPGRVSPQARIPPVDVPATRSTSSAVRRRVRRSISASTSAGISPRMPPPSMQSTFTGGESSFPAYRLGAMTPRQITRAALAAAALAAVALAPAVAPGESGGAAPKKITGAGVGKVKLGKTFRELRDAGLLGRIRPGCPLGGPNTRSARLKAPLRGVVNLTQGSPRRVRDIMVRGGARARGVGVGSTIAQIRARF